MQAHDSPSMDEGGAEVSGIPALVQSGQVAEAEARLRRRLAMAGNDVDALHFLGLLCHQTGRATEAVALIRKASSLAPGVAFIHANLAEVLRASGIPLQAEPYAREAVRLAPDAPDFRLNLAMVLAALRRHGEALEAIDRVLAAQPQRIEALALKADLYFQLQRMDEALPLAARASGLDPSSIVLLTSLMRLRAWACDWRGREADVARLAGLLQVALADGNTAVLAGVNPFVAYEYPLPQRLREDLTEFQVRGIVAAAGPPADPPPARTRSDGARLRIGYVSADFHSHPTMHLMGSFFGLHDRAKFEVVAYSIGPDDGSEYRRKAVASVDRFIDISAETVEESAGRIRRDGIDILVDLKGLTYDARPGIFARRPAPLRVAWLGYPASTGHGLNDYAIVDAVTVPPGNASQFGERLAWMPHSYQVNDHLQAVSGDVPSRRELGLPESAFVYACFNHVYKIEPPVFASWMRILGRVTGSVLWLYGSNPAARRNLAAAAAAQGIDAARIVFADTLAKPLHLARLSVADLFLDTYLYNAHTGASDALWAGVPVLTRPGDSFASRVGASLVHAVGLPQLACASLEAYEETAVRLAREPYALRAMCDVLSARSRLPLFDTPRFVRDLERAYLTMWERHARGLAPESFRV